MTPTETLQQQLVELERKALARWLNGDPSGYLEISAPDVVYFDPYQERRVDGLDALRRKYEEVRGKIFAERFEILNPCVQQVGDAAVLTFNFASYQAGGEALRWNCTEVYRRDPAGWRIVQTHWSIAAAAGAAATVSA